MRRFILYFSLSMIIGSLCTGCFAELVNECYAVDYAENVKGLVVWQNTEENDLDTDQPQGYVETMPSFDKDASFEENVEENDLDTDQTQGYIETMHAFNKNADSRQKMRFWDKCGIIYSSLNVTRAVYCGAGKANSWFSEISLGNMLWLDLTFLHTVLFIDLNICMAMPASKYVIQGERDFLFQSDENDETGDASYTPYFKDVMVRYIVATLPEAATTTRVSTDRYIDAALGAFLGEVNIQTFDLIDNSETEAILIHRIMLNRLIGGVVFNIFIVNTHADRKKAFDYASMNTSVGFSLFSGNRSDRLTYVSFLGKAQDPKEAVLLDAVLDIKLGRTDGAQSSYGFSLRVSIDLVFNKFLQIYNSLPLKNWKSDICRSNVQIGVFLAC